MEEFGTPERSATKDANAGFINPPAKQPTALATTVAQRTKGLSTTDSAMVNVGSALGGALSSFLNEKKESINEQRVIDAETRQGVDSAINAVDEVKKRTGWEKAVFGENIEYRAAQQRAVTNKVRASHLEQLAKVDGYAGDTPEQYQKRLKGWNTGILAQYNDDPETKKLVATALAQSNKDLAGAQYKGHYAYNQLQQQETVRTEMMQNLDLFSLEKVQNISPAESQQFLTKVQGFFSESGRPEGMTPVAYRAVKLGVVKEHMSKGNTGALKAAQVAGFDKGLSAAEQAQWDGALAAYDKHMSGKADLIRTTADIAITEATTIPQLQNAISVKQRDLSQLFQGASGTMASQQVIASGNLDVAKDAAAMRKQQEAMAKAARKAASDAVDDNDKNILMMIEVHRENMNQAIDLAETPADKAAAVDAYYQMMGELGQELSPALAQTLKYERLQTSATAAQAALNKELKADQAKVDKKTLKIKEQESKDAQLAEFMATSDTAKKAGLQHTNDFTVKEKSAAFDTHLLKGAQNFVGGDLPPTAEEFSHALRDNPQLQTWALGEMGRVESVSPMLKGILQNTVQATDRLYDEDGNPSEDGRKTVAMVNKLLESPKGVALIGGVDALRNWKQYSVGVNAGSGKDATEKRVVAYNQNKGKMDSAGFSWKNVVGKQNRRDWMDDRLTKLGVRNPSQQMITDELENYKQDMVAFGMDSREADNSTAMRVMNGKTQIFNSRIQDGGWLNDVTDYAFEDLINGAEKADLMAGIYSPFKTADSGEVRSQTQVYNLQWFTKPNVDGVFATSPSHNDEVFISTARMREMGKLLNERKVVQRAATAKAQSNRTAAMYSKLYY